MTKIRRSRLQRRGAAHILIALMLVVSVFAAGFTINLAYIQLLRVEHKVATDAAAQAAVESLLRTESVEDARAAATAIAAAHNVGSQSLALDVDDIDFGRSAVTESGQYTFQEGATPYNSARVFGRIGTTGSNSAINMLFGGPTTFQYARDVDSVSTFLINEVCLCLDRSGSMKFDDTGVTWSYPPNNPYVNSNEFNDNYYGRPHPTDSRWAMLRNGVNVFMTEAEAAEAPPRLSLVTWSTEASTDLPLPNSSSWTWSANRSAIDNAIADRGQQTGSGSNSVFGSTQLKLGLEQAIATVEDADSHEFATRTILLFTDGVYQGPDPMPAAVLAHQKGITIHCITFITGEAYDDMEALATATGGTAYMVFNETELAAAFRDIARSLNIVLTK